MVLDPLLLLGCEELGVSIVLQAELADVQGLLGVHLLIQSWTVISVEATIEIEIDGCRLAPHSDVGGSRRGAGDDGVGANLAALTAGESTHIKPRHPECSHLALLPAQFVAGAKALASHPGYWAIPRGDTHRWLSADASDHHGHVLDQFKASSFQGDDPAPALRRREEREGHCRDNPAARGNGWVSLLPFSQGCFPGA